MELLDETLVKYLKNKKVLIVYYLVNSCYTLGLLNSIELNHKNEIINKLIKTNDNGLF